MKSTHVDMYDLCVYDRCDVIDGLGFLSTIKKTKMGGGKYGFKFLDLLSIQTRNKYNKNTKKSYLLSHNTLLIKNDNSNSWILSFNTYLINNKNV